MDASEPVEIVAPQMAPAAPVDVAPSDAARIATLEATISYYRDLIEKMQVSMEELAQTNADYAASLAKERKRKCELNSEFERVRAENIVLQADLRLAVLCNDKADRFNLEFLEKMAKLEGKLQNIQEENRKLRAELLVLLKEKEVAEPEAKIQKIINN